MAETTTQNEPIELSTERPQGKQIRIDGTLYELRSASGLSLRETNRMMRTARRFKALGEGFLDESKELTDDDLENLEKDFETLVASLFCADPPHEALAKLSDFQKLKIVGEVFPKAGSEPGISPMLSQGSNGSTEGTSATGST